MVYFEGIFLLSDTLAINFACKSGDQFSWEETIPVFCVNFKRNACACYVTTGSIKTSNWLPIRNANKSG